MKIEIQQRVGLNPFCICHPIISFHNKEKLIFMQIQSRLRVTCVIEHSLNRKKDTKDEMKYGLQKIE